MKSAFNIKSLCIGLMLVLSTDYSEIQSQNADSLKAIWYNKTIPDSVRLHAIDVLSWDVYLYSIPDTAHYYAQIYFEYAQKKGLKKHMAISLNTQGIANFIQGNYEEAKNKFTACLKYQLELNDIKGAASTCNNLGVIYTNQGNDVKAIEYYAQSLKQSEQINDLYGVAASQGNIGLIYQEQGESKKALEYFLKSKEIASEIGDKEGVAMMSSNIGMIYSFNNDNKKALEQFELSIKIYEELNDLRGISTNYNNIGTLYKEIGDFKKAFEFYEKSLTIRKEINHKQGVASTLNSIGELFFKQGDFAKSRKYSEEGLKLAKEIGVLDDVKKSSILLYQLYKTTKVFDKALEMHELYMITRDSILSEENQKALIHQEYQYSYEKMAFADSLKNAQEKQLKDAEINEGKALAAKQEVEIKNKRFQQYVLFGGLFILLVFIGFIYNRFKITQRQKDIIEKQKTEVELQREFAEQQRNIAEEKRVEADEQRHLVEEKNKEITDSINYAKRIQEAILPSRYSLVENLKNGFIFFKPKDVVSGDFYWLETTTPIATSFGGGTGVVFQGVGTGVVYFAAADCTGHGVPGAMVSVICSNALSKALLEEGITETGKLLDRTRELVIERFAKSGEKVKDGMDISLCKLHGNTLEWSGANNPLWIVSKNSEGEYDLTEVKADKQPIGNYAEPKPFTSHTFELSKGDSIYIFTDGFADQFGGPKGKKFMYKPFKELLLSIQDKKMDEQKVILENQFNDWKGSHEQIDDVCIIGVRL
jgi:serine phosphatase RsbU (regulator of sigma subunit)